MFCVPEPRSTLLEAANEGQAEPCQQVQPTGLFSRLADSMQVAFTSALLHGRPQHHLSLMQLPPSGTV